MAAAPVVEAMTSQGTAHGRFQRAIRDRYLGRATMAAREFVNVSLADALALTLLTADVGDDRGLELRRAGSDASWSNRPP